MAYAPDPDDVLRWASTGTSPHEYVIGCGEPRVTVESQQVRALNLIWALGASGAVTRDVAIIGAGIAGCTAAVAASVRDWNVLLLERESAALTLQAGCTQRWIHPRIIDWPHPDAFITDAGLPLMNWSAGPASEAVARMLAGFQRECRRGNIELATNAHSVQVTGSDVRYTTNNSGPHTRRVDAVIFAVGFGTESQSVGYWRESDLEQYQNRQTVVVSGGGDGALAEVMRLRLGSGGHGARFFDWLAESQDALAPLAPEVAAMERKISHFTRMSDARATARKAEFSNNARAYYDSIFSSGNNHAAALQDRVLEQLRKDNDVLLISDVSYDPSASPLYRFLLSALLSQRGRHQIDPNLQQRLGRSDPTSRAYIPRGWSHPSSEDLTKTRWLVRHGPSSALARDFIDIASSIEARRSAFGYSWSRSRLWPENYFTPHSEARGE